MPDRPFIKQQNFHLFFREENITYPSIDYVCVDYEDVLFYLRRDVFNSLKDSFQEGSLLGEHKVIMSCDYIIDKKGNKFIKNRNDLQSLLECALSGQNIKDYYKRVKPRYF